MVVHKIGSFETEDSHLAMRLQTVFDLYEESIHPSNRKQNPRKFNRSTLWSRVFWDIAEHHRPILDVIATW